MPALHEGDVVRLLQGEQVTIAFDTNAIFGDNPRSDLGLKLIDQINEVNEQRRARALSPIRKVIPAPVWMEKLHDMRQRYASGFDMNLPLGVLRTKEVEIRAFDEHHATHAAKMLGERFPDDESWRKAKQDLCAKCLGVDVPANPSKGSKCGATIDWLIAGQADAEQMLLVTADQDDAFDRMLRRTTLATLETSLKALQAVYALSPYTP